MKNLIIKSPYTGLRVALGALFFSFLVVSCTALDPQKVDVELKKTEPVGKITTFTQPLIDMGLMTEIYDMPPLKIQSNPISDNTGASGPTGGEIPRDITEMIKSSLNSIGGRIVYIPYDPAFVQNQMLTGYSEFENKVIPDVVLSGGITEFDRGLETRGANTDVSAKKEFQGVPDFLPNKEINIRYGGSGKGGLARITLDFNLLDFRTLTGLPRMNAVNTMEVGKAQKEKELAVGLFGLNFGRKGTIRKVQGRHDAVRLLVELSMIQITGRYYGLPYWRLIGDDALPDEQVMRALKKYFYSMNEEQRIFSVQEYLFLHGYNVQLDGVLDASTRNALHQFDSSYNPDGSKISVDTFVKLYLSIPIDEAAYGRREMINRHYQEQELAMIEESTVPLQTEQGYQERQAQESVAQVPVQETYETTDPVAQQSLPTVEETIVAVKKTPSRKPSRSVGRILTEEEW